MPESLKAVVSLAFGIFLMATIFVWCDPEPMWLARVGFPVGAAVTLLALVWSKKRADLAPDFLLGAAGSYYERDGFCFAIVPTVEKGRLFLNVFFQNRYERGSRAQVVIRPSKGFFMSRGPMAQLTMAVECPGGGYGVTRIPFAVPRKFQGMTQSFDVAGQTSYPKGRGVMLRFHDGIGVGRASFDAWREIATVAAAFAGIIIVSRPAKCKVPLPDGVADWISDETPIRTEILWRLGDPVPGSQPRTLDSAAKSDVTLPEL